MTIISQVTIPQRAYCVSFCRNVRALLVSSKKYLKHEEQTEKKEKAVQRKVSCSQAHEMALEEFTGFCVTI